jgi:hypothetical protein
VLTDPKQRPFPDGREDEGIEDEEYDEVVRVHWNSIKTSFR